MKRLLIALLASFLLSPGAATARATDFQDVLVKPGDTLWSISKKYLKDPARWDEIVKYNRSISSDPTIALPGMTLRVPTELIKEELRAAHLVARVNNVEFRRNATARWNAATDNMDLYRNDWIRTLDESAASVRFLDSDQLHLGANSMAVIKPVNKDYAVDLKRGGTFFGRAKIITAGAVVSPQSKDTRYIATVRDDMSTKVEVLKGEALVAAAGQTVSVKTGMVSEVTLGLAPSVPTKIADMSEFQARAANLAKGGNGMLAGLHAPTVSVKAPKAAPIAVADTPKAQLADLKLGSMVSGYRIQCSENPDLSELLVSKNVDLDQEVTARFLGIPAGQYWCRVAPLDLLGALGKYTSPRRYTLK